MMFGQFWHARIVVVRLEESNMARSVLTATKTMNEHEEDNST